MVRDAGGRGSSDWQACLTLGAALLFGCSRVYRNMFTKDKYVYLYQAKHVREELGLSRANVRVWTRTPVICPRNASD